MKTKKIVQRTSCILLMITALLLVFRAGYYKGTKQVNITAPLKKESATKPMAPVFTPQKNETLRFVPKQLNGQEKVAYEQLQKTIWDMSPSTTISDISYQQLINIERLLFQSPEIFWIKSPAWFVEQETGYQLFFEYCMTVAERDEVLEKIDTITTKILQHIDSDNPQEIIHAGCNWLQKNTRYASKNGLPNESVSSQSITGPLLEKEGICSGYAKTILYLLGKAGHPIGYCMGWYNDTYHAWVAFETDEQTFYIDPTACVTINSSSTAAEELGLEYNLEVLDWYTPAKNN